MAESFGENLILENVKYFGNVLNNFKIIQYYNLSDLLIYKVKFFNINLYIF